MTYYKEINGKRVAMTAAQISEMLKSETDNNSQFVRAERNKKLSDTDWTQLPDAPVDSAVWETYRQALRDITEQAGFPENVTWPTQPQ